jgi:soluble lytic murein transglycosylase
MALPAARLTLAALAVALVLAPAMLPGRTELPGERNEPEIAAPPVADEITVEADEIGTDEILADEAEEVVAEEVLAAEENPPTAEAAAALDRALDAAGAGEWDRAQALAAEADDPVVPDIVRWTRLREGTGTWEEYRSFLAETPHWPGLAVLRRQGERRMPADLPPETVKAYFSGSEPQTGTGLARLAAAVAAEDSAAAEALVVAAWPVVALTREEQAALLDAYGPSLSDAHAARADALLWDERLGEAELLMPRLDDGWRALAEARIGLRRDAGNVDTLIGRVPAALADDPGLAYERYQWRVRKGRWDEAESWLLAQSESVERLGRPDAWMARRPGLARQALARGEVETAYRIAAQNFGSAGADFAEAEWLAGYIALTGRDDPATAIDHFERFEAAVLTPISLGRAGYWLGLAHEAAGDPAAAQAAFERGAVHQTSFYGQLAAERAGASVDPRLAGVEHGDWRAAEALRSDEVRAGRLLLLAGLEARALQFFRHAAETMGEADRAALSQMLIDLGHPHLGVRLAKDAASAGIVIPSQYYPTHPIAESEWPVPTEFALAVARQESEFNPAAVSHAGARGLMQLMPATARQVTDRLGLPYDEGRLVSDPDYNARLGTAYLGQMLDNYGGSYVLAAAAYNAGPGRVRQWLDTFGDPRRGEIEPVIWVETIPFTETRNYVMRVLEALHVYRARLAGETQPVRLAADLAS